MMARVGQAATYSLPVPLPKKIARFLHELLMFSFTLQN
jgi:hypothetical protein